MNIILEKNILNRVLAVVFLCFSINSFAQKVVFYSDTLTFEQAINPEVYYAIQGNTEELIESPQFRDVVWFTNQLEIIKSQKKLNDYFVFEIIKKYSEVFFKLKNTEKYKTAFIYNVLNELNFDLILSNKNTIYVHSIDKVYNTPLYKKGGKEYYQIYPLLGGGAYFYNIEVKKKTNKNRFFDFRVRSAPNMHNAEYIHKEISFAIGNRVYKEVICLNKTVIAMFEKYPQSYYCVYEQTDFSDSLKISFEKNILPKLKGVDNKQTVWNILSFSQSVSEYKSDISAFGKSRYIFPEEFLFYNKGDCEDFSFLFVYLVRSYAKLNTVLINYPNHNHMNSAVHIPEKIEGKIRKYTLEGDEYFEEPYSIKIQGKDYYICDPTGVLGRKAGEAIKYDLIIGDKPKYGKYEIINCGDGGGNGSNQW